MSILSPDEVRLMLERGVGSPKGPKAPQIYTPDPMEWSMNDYRQSVIGLNRDIEPFYHTGDIFALYGGDSRYDEGTPFQDVIREGGIQDWRASQQSTVAKWASVLPKFGTIAATSFLDSTFGTLWGALEALATWDGNKFVDNSFTRSMLNIQEFVDEALPLYQSMAEMEAPWYNRLGKANFWAEVVVNQGFTAGTIAAMAVTGHALGALTRGWAAYKMGKGVYSAANANKLKGLMDGLRNGSMSQAQISKELLAAGNFLKKADPYVQKAAALLGSTGYARIEATSHARQLYEQLSSQYDNNWQEDLPQLRDSIQRRILSQNPGLSPQEIDQLVQKEINYEYSKGMENLDKLISAHTNITFATDLFYLTITNSMMWGKFASSNYKVAKSIDANSVRLKTPNVLKDGFEAIVKSPLQRAQMAGGRILKNPTVQFFEESFLHVNRETSGDFHSAIFDKEATGDLNEFREAYIGKMADTFLNIDNWESGMMGFIGGFLGGIGPKVSSGKLKGVEGRGGIWEVPGAIKQAARYNQIATAQAEALNKKLADPNLQAMYRGAVRRAAKDKEAQQALFLGDKFGFDNAAADSFISDLLLFEELGLGDQFVEMVNIGNKISAQEAREIFATKIEGKEGVTETIDPFEGREDSEIESTLREQSSKFKELVKVIKERSTDLDLTLGLRPFTPEQASLIKNQMIYYLASMENMRARLTMLDKNPNLPANLKSLIENWVTAKHMGDTKLADTLGEELNTHIKDNRVERTGIQTEDMTLAGHEYISIMNRLSHFSQLYDAIATVDGAQDYLNTIAKIEKQADEDNKNEAYSATNIPEQFKTVIQDGTFKETIKDVDGKDQEVTHRGSVKFKTIDLTKPLPTKEVVEEGKPATTEATTKETTDTTTKGTEKFEKETPDESGIGNEVQADIVGINSQGNLVIDFKGQHFILNRDGSIAYKKNGKWVEHPNRRWRDVEVTRTGKEARLDNHKNAFRKAVEKQYYNVVDRISKNKETLTNLNTSLTNVENTLAKAKQNKSGKAKYTHKGEAEKLQLVRAIEIGKNVYLTVKELENIKKSLELLRDSTQKVIEQDLSSLESFVEQFASDSFSDITESLKQERINAENLVENSQILIDKITKRIANLKKNVKALMTQIENRVKRFLDTTDNVSLHKKGAQYLLKSETLEVLDKVLAEREFIESLEQQIADRTTKIEAAENELLRLQEELPDLKRELDVIEDAIRKRQEVLVKYNEIIQQEWLKPTTKPVVIAGDKKTVEGEDTDTNVKEDESDVQPAYHKFTGKVQDLFVTTTAQHNFELEENQVAFEPQLAFSQFIDDYDTSTGDKKIRLVNKERLIELTAEHFDLSSQNLEDTGVYAIVVNSDGSVHTVDGVFLPNKGKQIPLISTLPEAQKIDGVWVNLTRHGGKVVGEEGWMRENNKSEDAFNVAFHNIYEFYDSIKQSVLKTGQAINDFEITGKTIGSMREKESKNSVIGTIVDNASQLNEIEIVVGDGTMVTVGDFSQKLSNGIVKIKYKDRLINTYRENLSPAEAEQVIDLLRGLALNATTAGMLDAYIAAIDDLTEIKTVHNNNPKSFSIGQLSKDGPFVIRFGKEHITFEALTSSKEADQVQLEKLRAFLNDKYYNVKKDPLKTPNNPFTQYLSENIYDENGNLTSSELVPIEWGSYHEYLLSQEGDRTPRFKVKMPSKPTSALESLVGNTPFLNRSLRFHIPYEFKKEDSYRGEKTEVKKEAESGLKLDPSKRIGSRVLSESDAAEWMEAEPSELSGDKPIVTSQEEDGSISSKIGDIDINVAEESTPAKEDVGEQPKSEPDLNYTPDIIDGLFGEGKNITMSDPVGDTTRVLTKDQLDEFKQKFTNTPVVIDDNLAVEAMTQLKDGKITVFVRPETVSDALFHEGYHIVETAFLTQEERSSLYNEARKRLGKKVVEVEGTEVTGESMTDTQASEFIAEEYRNYRIIGSKDYKFGKAHGVKQTWLQKAFEKISEAINNLLNFFGLRHSKGKRVESLFERIEQNTWELPSVVRIPDVTKFRIGDLTSEQSKIAVDNFLFRFINKILFKHTHTNERLDDILNGRNVTVLKSVLNDILEDIKAEAEEIKERGEVLPDGYMYLDKKHMPKIIKETFKRLKQLSVKVNTSRDVIESDNATLEQGEVPVQFMESMRLNVMDYVSTEVKLLIQSLPKKERTSQGVAKVVKDGLDVPVDYATTVGWLHKHLANVSSYPEMVKKLDSLSDKFPHYAELLNLLGSNVENPHQNTNSRLYNLRVAFYNQFKKSQSEFILGVIKNRANDRGIYMMDSMGENIERNITEQWRANVATGNVPNPNLFNLTKDGKLRINKDATLTVNGKTFKFSSVLGSIDKLHKLTPQGGILTEASYREFLNHFGFNIPKEYVANNKAARDTMRTLIQMFLQDAGTLDLIRSKKNNPGIYLEDLYDRDLIKVAKELKELANGLSEYTTMFIGNQRFDSKGRRIYNINIPNHIDRVLESINLEMPQSLIPITDGGSNVGTVGSRWYEVSKRGDKIKKVVLTAFGEERGDKTDTNTLKHADFLIFEVNALLDGHLPYMRSSERSVETAFRLPEGYIKLRPVKKGSDGNFVISVEDYNVFRDYLKGEIVSALEHSNNEKFKHFNKNENYKGLSVFEQIVPPSFVELIKKAKHSTHKEQLAFAEKVIDSNKTLVRDAIQKYLTDQTNDIINYLEHNGVIIKSENSVDARFLDKSIVKELLRREEGKKAVDALDFEKMPMDEFVNIMHTFTFEYLSSSIEQTKFITGDVKQFTKGPSNDLHKRTTLHVATVEGSINDNGFIEFLNSEAPRIDGTVHSSNIVSITREDVKVDSYLHDEYSKILGKESADVYLGMTENDAAALFTPDGYESAVRRSAKYDSDVGSTIQYDKQTLYRDLMKVDPKRFNEKNFKRVFKKHLPDNYDPSKRYFEKKELTFDKLSPVTPLKLQSVGKIQNPSLTGANKVQSMKAAFFYMSPTTLKHTNRAAYNDLIQAVLAGVDVVLPKSARKHEVLGNDKGQLAPVYDKEGNTVPINEIFDNSEDGAFWKEEVSWDDIGNQLDIDPDGKNKITFSVQMRRLIAVDIQSRGEYRIPGYEQEITEYNTLLREIVERDLQALTERLGLSKTAEGEWNLVNDAKFIETILEQLDSRLQPDNVADSAVYVIKQAEKYFQLLPTHRQIVNLIQGLIRNNVIKTKTSGDMLVQQPNTGFETSSRSRNSKGILTSGDLKYYTPVYNSEGKVERVDPAQARVSLRAEWLPHIAKSLGHSSFTEATLALFNEKIHDKEWEHYDAWKQVRLVLANRTPAQHLNSIDVFDIIEFLPHIAGPVIVLPSETVAKTGSDYDIDKLNVYFNNMSFGENGAPVYAAMGENVAGSSKEALQNRVYEISKKLALAPESLSSLLRPNSSNLVDNLAKELRPEMVESKNISEMIGFRYNAQIAKTQWGAAELIGIAAVNMTTHPILQAYPVTLNGDLVEVFFDGFKGTQGEYSFGYYQDQGDNIISHNFGEVATAVIDASKHSLAPIDLINLNTATSNAYFLLNMLGRGKTSPTAFGNIAYFFTRPIILDVEQSLANNESLFKRSMREGTEKRKVVEKTLEKHGLKVSPDYTFLYEKMLTFLRANTEETRELAKAGVKKHLDDLRGNEASYLNRQTMDSNPMLVLEMHLYYKELGKVLRMLQDVTRPDAGISKSRDYVRLREKRADQLKESGIFDNSSLDNLLNNSYIGKYSEAHKETYDAFNKFDIIEDVPVLRDFMWSKEGLMDIFMNKELSKGLDNLVEIKQKVTNALLATIVHNVTTDKGHTLQDFYGAFMDGKNSMANRLERLKKQYGSDNAFLSEAIGVVKEYLKRSNTNRKGDYIKFYNRILTTEQANAITESIQDLANHSDPEARAFAKDLAYMSIIQSGFQLSPVSFFERLPHQIYHSILQGFINKFKRINPTLGRDYKRVIFNNLRQDPTVVPREYGKRSLSTDKQTLSIHPKSQNRHYEYLSREIEDPQTESSQIYVFEKTGEVDNKGNWVYRRLNPRGDGYAMFDGRMIKGVPHPNINYNEGILAHVTFDVQEGGLTLPVKPITTAPVGKQMAMFEGEALPTTHSVTKIISGGQTGVDMAGLDAALEAGIETGGTAAAYFTQSVGEKKSLKNPELAKKYNLKEGKVTKRSDFKGRPYDDVYYQRTIDNAQNADGTIWFGSTGSPGGRLTLGTIAQKGKPKPLTNPTSKQEILNWLNKHNIKTLNVAGNREHTNPGIYNQAKNLLLETLRQETKGDLAQDDNGIPKTDKERIELAGYITTMQLLNEGNFELTLNNWFTELSKQNSDFNFTLLDAMLNSLLLNKFIKKDAGGVLEFVREYGRKWFTDNKSKLAQLDTGERLKPSELKADKAMLDTLKTIWNKLGITTHQVDSLVFEGKPVNAVAVANVVSKTIQYLENKRKLDTLPEETAHIYVGLLKSDSPIRKAMFNKITGTPYYAEVVRDYKELYKGDVEKLKTEAVGKALADAMVKINNERVDSSLWNQVRNWLRGVLREIKQLFNIGSPYNKVAYDMLEGNLKDVVTKGEIEQGEFLQRDYTNRRLTVQDDVFAAKMEQQRIENLKRNQEESNRKTDFLLTSRDNITIFDKDAELMAQSDAEMLASEKRVIETNEKELVKVQQSIIKQGVLELFESNPELANVGTQQQYSQYLDTIFTDSKVKDIVYHGTNNKEQILKEGFKNNSELYPSDDDRAYESGELGYGYYFTPSQKAAKNYGETVAVILNNPDITNETTFNLITNERGIQHFVKTKEQIHILGSKQDIEGFRKFVSEKPTISTSSRESIIQEQLANFEKFYPEAAEKLPLQEARRAFVEQIMDGKLKINC